MSYYVHRGGQTLGPYSPTHVVNMLRAHQLAIEDLAVEEGCEDWKPLGNIVDLELLTAAPAPAAPPPISDQSERVFYSEPGAMVTLSRFIIGSQTFAMRNISSVKLKRIRASRGVPILGLLIGLFFAFAGEPGPRSFGIILSLVMLIVLIFQRAKYAIILTASGGEVRALTSKDRKGVARIVAALNEAMVARA